MGHYFSDHRPQTVTLGHSNHEISLFYIYLLYKYDKLFISRWGLFKNFFFKKNYYNEEELWNYHVGGLPLFIF